MRLLALLTMNSFINIDFDQFWRANPVASAVAFFNYISSRYVFSRRAFEFRERLLEWIPARLSEVKFGGMTLARLPEVYMHCSYAMTAKKHAIKRPLMAQMRRACLEAGAVEATIPIPEKSGERATIVVVGERFTPGHAIFRTHSRAVQSLREKFRLVGVLEPNPIGTPVADLFDECIAIPRGDFFAAVRTAAAEIAARRPVLIFYPSIGMVPQVIALAALRLAPIQCASYGHMATTIESGDGLHDFSRRFYQCAALLFRKNSGTAKGRHAVHAARAGKRNTTAPRRNGPCRHTRLDDEAQSAAVRRALHASVPAPRRPLRSSFFLWPPWVFPISNCLNSCEPASRAQLCSRRRRIPLTWNGFPAAIFSCARFPTATPTASSIHFTSAFRVFASTARRRTRIHNSALFARIGLPAELTAQSVDDYVAAAIKMIDDEAWRAHCTDIVRNANLDAAFFSGDPSLFCAAIENLIWPAAA